MKQLILPPRHGDTEAVVLPKSGHVSLVGASGSGKTRFMEEMFISAGSRARRVSAVDDSVPAVPVSHRPGLAENIVSLSLSDPRTFSTLCREWESFFPGNTIVITPGNELRFVTASGSDRIGISRLSRGESAALTYLAAVLTAPRNAVLFVDSPTLFLHPALSVPLWNSAERLRPDCRFVYDTSDPSFVGSRSSNTVVWVRSFYSATADWDYELLPASDSARAFVDLIGTRRPILFIEGDAEHSIDARLYSLVFPDYTVRPLGSCDKVIETTRTFRYLSKYHTLETRGIVDRDRRSDSEVDYLRQRSVMVAEVAEIENIFLTEGVVRVMAEARGLDPDRTFRSVRDIVYSLFSTMFEAQALQHTRHRMKRDVERKIDGRFTCITALELHIKGLIHTLNPRDCYNTLMKEFTALVRRRDHAGILKVFNHKPMLTATSVPHLLGFDSAEDYISGVLSTLRSDPVNGPRLRDAIKSLFLPVASGSGELSPEDSDHLPPRRDKGRRRHHGPGNRDRKPESPSRGGQSSGEQRRAKKRYSKKAQK